jgi:hypothetical protein
VPSQSQPPPADVPLHPALIVLLIAIFITITLVFGPYIGKHFPLPYP